MKMWRLLFPVLLLGLVLFFDPATAQAAKRITMHNKTGNTIDAVLVVRTYNGWRVHGWYAIAPYSYRTVNFTEAGGETFGAYATTRNANTTWGGQNTNGPAVTIVSNRMNHDVRQQPYGNNQRRVKVLMKQGNQITFNPPQGYQQPRNTGWW